jgi:hypothetical protein
MDMRFGTWNVRSMYRAGSLRAVAEETVVIIVGYHCQQFHTFYPIFSSQG